MKMFKKVSCVPAKHAKMPWQGSAQDCFFSITFEQKGQFPLFHGIKINTFVGSGRFFLCKIITFVGRVAAFFAE
jgi:hypothetical protein